MAQPAAPPLSTGNLAAGFYIAASCQKPGQFTLAKPTYGDRQGIAIYNGAVRRHNGELMAFAACINDYIQKASNDIDWIMFTVNVAVTKASGTSPPAAPTAPGNMAASFHPSSGCIAPDRQQLGVVPDGHDTKAMEAHNRNVETYNGLADGFNACIKGYVSRAQVDIRQIEDAQRDAASQVSEQERLSWQK